MKRQLIVGLPSTGKTTFLAALWHVVTSNEIPTSLQLDSLEQEREYVNTIYKDWISFDPVARTKTSSLLPISMKLKDGLSGSVAEVNFPDISGETYRAQLLDRTWTKEFEDIVQSSTGLIVFLHPEQVQNGLRIDEVDDAMASIGDSSLGAVELHDKEPLPFTEENIPTQVKMVELLQLIASRSTNTRTLPTALIVSAWDLVEKSFATPEAWLARNMPLLHQFFKTNLFRFPVSIYGISAQGGNLANQEEADALKARMTPSARIKVVVDNQSSHDITNPIKWLIEKQGKP